MNVLILEDELITAEELQHYLRDILPDVQILAVLETVEEAVEYLEGHPSPQLIFSDIQLADGLSFEVFEQVPVRCPVIFCTAFDEYAMQAFTANGIAYVLKPFDRKAIANSLARFDTLQNHFQVANEPGAAQPAPAPPDLNEPLQRLLSQLKPQTRSSFLVNQKGKYFPVLVDDVAFFYTEHEVVWLQKASGEKYPVDYTLDELESQLNAAQFYRANRQFIIRFEAVKELEPYFNRKLLVRLRLATPEPVIISKAKATDFMRWLEQR
ncbi:MAG: DNA-binding response regulator [Cytophagales bacterium]|nr:MAG: DNA-binding response regulator [Cytophagales bacterium]